MADEDFRFDDFEVVVQQELPYDGPHTRESVLGAGSGLSALVRYLNNATTKAAPLEWAQTTYQLIGSVNAVAFGLQQLLDQLGAKLRSQAAEGVLYDDRNRKFDGAATAYAAADCLAEAVEALPALQQALQAAHSAAGHLGNND